jgi:hypothetical protein
MSKKLLITSKFTKNLIPRKRKNLSNDIIESELFENVSGKETVEKENKKENEIIKEKTIEEEIIEEEVKIKKNIEKEKEIIEEEKEIIEEEKEIIEEEIEIKKNIKKEKEIIEKKIDIKEEYDKLIFKFVTRISDDKVKCNECKNLITFHKDEKSTGNV